MFKVGDYIIYGSNGVCRVEKIGAADGLGMTKDKIYYTLVPEYAQTSKVFTPANNEKVTMRLVMSREEALGLIESIHSLELMEVEEGKRKDEVYKEALRNGDSREWTKIIKTLYLKKQERLAAGKKVTAEDEKYLHKAEEILFGELALPLEMEKTQVENLILEKLENM